MCCLERSIYSEGKVKYMSNKSPSLFQQDTSLPFPALCLLFDVQSAVIAWKCYLSYLSLSSSWICWLLSSVSPYPWIFCLAPVPHHSSLSAESHFIKSQIVFLFVQCSHLAVSLLSPTQLSKLTELLISLPNYSVSSTLVAVEQSVLPGLLLQYQVSRLPPDQDAVISVA